jgi:hypothetical protein
MNYRPACHVTNKTGVKIQDALFKELLEKMESIAPGATKTL